MIETTLKPCLTAFDLTLLGIGAIIGAGIFVITGIVAATSAGPAILISYIFAALACTFSALSYAELASTFGGSGSAYNYALLGLGDQIAWIIGWNLILEYALVVATVSQGWGAYIVALIRSFGVHYPYALEVGPFMGGIINLPAMTIILLIIASLILGVKTSVRINAILVMTKLIVISLFIFIAFQNINFKNWDIFAPFGWNGIMQGAGVIFFAYIGFDAVSTAAEETINPQRNLPIGILGSLIICTVLYIIVSALLTLIVPYYTLNNAAPIANALLKLGYRTSVSIISAGAIAGLSTVILVMYYGLSRILLAMSRDHMLPFGFAKINDRTRAPVRIILTTGVVVLILAAFIPIDVLAELVNIGTLSAFTIVCASVIILRYKKPDIHRPFKTPFSPVVPILGIICCLYLIISLKQTTWIRFIVWTIAGFVIYFSYSRKKRRILKETVAT
ncbi:MAG: amino acid permease [Gammaproteobacteria bacterium]